MSGGKLCPECGASRRITREHEWLDNGLIVQRANPDHRMLFIETGNVSAIFSGVEELIGMSIQRIIEEAKRKATYDFIGHMVPDFLKPVVRLVGVRPVIRNVINLGSVMGYGRMSLVSVRRIHGKGDFVTVTVRDIYSLPLFCGDLAGTFNAVDSREVQVTCRQVSPDEYEITAHISTVPLELRERLLPKEYPRKEGDLALPKCPRCGGPRALSGFSWDLERGVIVGRDTGRRMAMIGPAALDAIIDELEKELGESIPATIVEAQRRFVRTGFYSLEEVATEDLFREQLALRGLGNVREVKWGENSIAFRMENACLHPVIVGLVLGFFELATGNEGEADWRLEDDGDLVVEVRSVA